MTSIYHMYVPSLHTAVIECLDVSGTSRTSVDGTNPIMSTVEMSIDGCNRTENEGNCPIRKVVIRERVPYQP